MVSLGSARGYFYDADAGHDNEILVDDAIISCEEERFNFRPISIVWAIVTEIILLVSFEILVFVLPEYYDPQKLGSGTSSTSIIVYSHFVVWCLLLIFGQYLHNQQNKYRRSGYLEFYINTSILRQIPVYVLSAGNSLLLLTVVLLEDYCKESFPKCPSHSNLRPYHYVQIITSLELSIVLPSLCCYLVRTIRFNRIAPDPDVEADERVLNFLYGQVPSTDIGFRDEDRLDDVLEKQADLIRYLKQHNARLGRKILHIMNELKTLKSRNLQIPT